VKRDTDPASTARYFDLLRALRPDQRLRATIALGAATRALAEAGVRARMPHAADRDRRRALVVVLYGEDAAVRLFGPRSDDP
jgi:hypothetical protein